MQGISPRSVMAFFVLALGALESFALAADPNPVAAESAPASFTLRYKFERDEVAHYQVDHETTLTSTKPEIVEQVTNEVQSHKQFRVVSLDSSGNATLELAINQVRMSARFGESKPTCFDSQTPQDCPPAYRPVREIIGKPLARVRVSPRGELLSSVPLLSPDVLARANMTPADASSSTDDPLRNFLIEFPEEPIQVGERWTNTFKVKVQLTRTLSQNVTLQRSYELEAVQGDVATLKLRTALITPIRDGMILGQLIQMTPKGTITFDLKQGRMLSRKLLVDKTEVGAIGPNSSMQAKSTREERWITPQAAIKTES